MTANPAAPHRYVEAIRRSGLSIYDPIEIGDPELWIPAPELEELLNSDLRGVSGLNLPIRTRSKVVKRLVCTSLGYPIPASFQRTRPRFPGQFFDIYVQKNINLQVWNEELEPTRRYVIIQVDGQGRINRVRVVTGETLALLDTTGTLTQKYQARLVPGSAISELVSGQDTNRLFSFVRPQINLGSIASPISQPALGQLMGINEIYERLRSLVGKTFSDAGCDQERNRGCELHKLVCRCLGYQDYRDDGRFPDVRHQLLEVKLQTSPTIDLGLICPNSTEPLDVPKINGVQIRHCDVRYALFYAKTDNRKVLLTHFFLTTGEKFFSRFPQFQGKILNKKLQIPLPANFFEV